MVSLATVLCFPGGCSVSHKTAVKPSDTPIATQTATRAQLLERYNRQADAIQSLNATVAMKLTSGSAYSGVIEQYHEVSGFILAAKPSSIRVIGQAPVIGKNIFDMVSDGKTFEMFIPSKHKFVTGPVNLERQSAKPLENLRPQHLGDALLWVAVPETSAVLFEQYSESNVRYYVLTVIRHPAEASGLGSARKGADDFEITQKIWFDRSDLHVARVENFGSGGTVSADVHYSDWQPAGGPSAERSYPRQIDIVRPIEDYRLAIHITKLTVDEPIAADRFVLAQPAGADLVRVGEDGSQNVEPAPKEPQQ